MGTYTVTVSFTVTETQAQTLSSTIASFASSNNGQVTARAYVSNP